MEVKLRSLVELQQLLGQNNDAWKGGENQEVNTRRGLFEMRCSNIGEGELVLECFASTVTMMAR